MRDLILSTLKHLNLSVVPEAYLHFYNEVYQLDKIGLKLAFLPYTVVSKKTEIEIRSKLSKEYILKHLPEKSTLPKTEVLNWKSDEYSSEKIVDSALEYRAYISSNQYVNWFGSKLMAKLTASGGRSYWRIETMRQLRMAIPSLFEGKVLEVGAGTALVSCAISHFEEIDELYTLDYDEYTVENLMPLVQWSLDAKTQKIKRVVGSYNSMDIKDDSFDTIVAVGSMHHSEDLNATMRECFRVLKPGGTFIVSDYALTGSLTQEEYAVMIDLPKNESDAARVEKGASIEGMLTNKTISEHARPAFLYQAAAFNAGFTVDCTFFDATKDNGGSFLRAARRLRESIRGGSFYQKSHKERVLGYDVFGNVRAFKMTEKVRYPSYAKKAPSLLSLLLFGERAGQPIYDNMVLLLKKASDKPKSIEFQYQKGRSYKLPVPRIQ